MTEGGYIQGAGDDSEGWSHGLTPELFWLHSDTFRSTTEEDLPRLIDELKAREWDHPSPEDSVLIRPTKNVFIQKTPSSPKSPVGFDLVINCAGKHRWYDGNPSGLDLGCGQGKLGSRDLRAALVSVREFVSLRVKHDHCSLLVAAQDGLDLAVGTALMILCLFYDDTGMQLSNAISKPSETKGAQASSQDFETRPRLTSLTSDADWPGFRLPTRT